MKEAQNVDRKESLSLSPWSNDLRRAPAHSRRKGERVFARYFPEHAGNEMEGTWTDQLPRRFERCLFALNYADSTVSMYFRTAHALARSLQPEGSLDTATRADVVRYLGKFDNRHQRDHEAQAVRCLFRFLALSGRRRDNPAAFVKIRRPRPLPHFLSEDAARKLIGAARSPRDRALLEFLYGTGCRVCEVVQVRVENIDWGPISAVRVVGKGQKERTLFFGAKARRALRKHLGYHCEGPLFQGRTGRALSKKTIWRIVSQAGKRAGQEVCPLMLRHTFATVFSDRGVDIRIIQEFLGHKWVSTTAIYTHTSMARIHEVYDQAHPHA